MNLLSTWGILSMLVWWGSVLQNTSKTEEARCCEQTGFSLLLFYVHHFIALKIDAELNFVTKCTVIIIRTVMYCFIGAPTVIIESSNYIFLRTAGKRWISIYKSRLNKLNKHWCYSRERVEIFKHVQKKKMSLMYRSRSNVELLIKPWYMELF